MSLGLLRIELRRGVVLLLSPLILAAAWWMAWNGMYGTMPEDVYIWQETSRVVKDSVLQAGPLVAGLSAWAAGRNRRRGMGDLLSTTPRPAAFRDLVAWAGAALPAVAVYALLTVLLGIPAALNATWGAPLAGYLVVGLVALLMDSALGFAAGHWLAGRFTAPLVAVGLYVAHLMPMGMVDLPLNHTLLSPAAYSNIMGADPFYEFPRLAVQQSLLFGGLCGAALSAVALGGRGVHWKARVTFAASVAVAAIGLVAALTTEDFDAREPEAVPFEPLCEEGAITVCVHPAFEKHLPKATRTVNEVAAPLVGIPGAPTRALQVSGPRTVPDRAKTENVALFGHFAPSGDLLKEEVVSGLVQDADAAHGPNIPREGGIAEEDLRRCGKIRYKKYFDPSYAAQAVVGRWLTERSGGRTFEMTISDCQNGDELVGRFAALAPAERRVWLEENLGDLRAGKVTLKDLP